MSPGPKTSTKSLSVCVKKHLICVIKKKVLLLKSDYTIAFEKITGVCHSPGAVCNTCEELITQLRSSYSDCKQ